MLLLLTLIACTDADKSTTDDSTPPADDSATDDTGPTPTFDGECELDVRLGGFAVEATTDYTVVDGAVLDGVIPASVLQPAGESGDCRLLQRLNPFCDPSCESDQTCDFDGTCIPYPLGQDLGTATITGLANLAEMSPVMPGYRYFYTDLPNPGYEAGAAIQLTTTGGTVPAFELDGMGVDQMEILDATWLIVDGADLTLSWTPPSVAGARVKVEMTIDQHGLTPFLLTCNFEDDGQGTVPAELITAFVANGVSGFPNGTMSRMTADQTTVGSGCIDFVVSSPRSGTVRVDGQTPCTSDDQCPEGQTCNEELEKCE